MIDHEWATFERSIAPKRGSERFAQIKRTDIPAVTRDFTADNDPASASVAKIGAAPRSNPGFPVGARPFIAPR